MWSPNLINSVTFFFQDGKTAKGTTLGMFKSTDSGLMRITDPGKYAYAEKGRSAELQNRPVGASLWDIRWATNPAARRSFAWGRILMLQDSVFQTDCPMINGDSGGPVFDLDGKVIGINSRIGGPTDQNLHVPVDIFTKNWDRLAKGDEWEVAVPKRENPEIKTAFRQIVSPVNPCGRAREMQRT